MGLLWYCNPYGGNIIKGAEEMKIGCYLFIIIILLSWSQYGTNFGGNVLYSKKKSVYKTRKLFPPTRYHTNPYGDKG